MQQRALINLLAEFLPVLGFFIVAQFASFFVATAFLMALTTMAIIVGWVFNHRLPALPIVSALFVLVSGALTLIWQNPDALIISDTIYYGLMGGVILIALFWRINLLKLIFDSTFAMSDEGWHRLAIRWITIFFIAAIANELVRYFLTPEQWVDYRFIKTVAFIVFSFYQFTLSRRYRIPGESNAWGLRTSAPPPTTLPGQ